MTTLESPQTPPAPSLAKLAGTTVLALVVAGALLMTVVLPAEYAIDPLGTGRWLGLTEIASPTIVSIEPAAPGGSALTPSQKGPVGVYPAEFKVDVVELSLQPYDYVEYKYRLEQAATMLYSWTASAAVIHDFHGERAEATNGAQREESFDKQNRRQASGSLTAPFAGIHGWYWENPGGEPITIRLTTAGFYTSAVEIHSDRSRHVHTLRGLDTLLAGASAPGRPQ